MRGGKSKAMGVLFCSRLLAFCQPDFTNMVFYQVIKSVGNVPRNSQAKAARMLTSPLLTTLWAAGLSFSKCHFERRVPNDPNLPFVFDGEEFSRTLRG